jgi:hypothetical protein
MVKLCFDTAGKTPTNSDEELKVLTAAFHGFFMLFALRGVNDKKDGQLKMKICECSESDFNKYWLDRVDEHVPELRACFHTYDELKSRGDKLFLMTDRFKKFENMSVVAVPKMIMDGFLGKFIELFDCYSRCHSGKLVGYRGDAWVMQAARNLVISAYPTEFKGRDVDKIAAPGGIDGIGSRKLCRCHGILAQIHYKARPEALARLAGLGPADAAAIAGAQNGDKFQMYSGGPIDRFNVLSGPWFAPHPPPHSLSRSRMPRRYYIWLWLAHPVDV